MRDDRERLRDILDAIDDIDRYAVRGKEIFLSDELVSTWILHHLIILGEAAASIDTSFRDRFPEIPWPQIVAFRNILIHHYFGVDMDEVWVVVERDLPELRRKIEGILGDMEK
jgi:uncharacterized protein with HEPN domain